MAAFSEEIVEIKCDPHKILNNTYLYRFFCSKFKSFHINYADDCIRPFTKEERLEAFSDYGLTFGLICDTSCRYYIQQERCQYKCK